MADEIQRDLATLRELMQILPRRQCHSTEDLSSCMRGGVKVIAYKYGSINDSETDSLQPVQYEGIQLCDERYISMYTAWSYGALQKTSAFINTFKHRVNTFNTSINTAFFLYMLTADVVMLIRCNGIHWKFSEYGNIIYVARDVPGINKRLYEPILTDPYAK